MGVTDPPATEAQSYEGPLTRRRAVKAGVATAGIVTVGGIGFWQSSKPAVAASVEKQGADNVVFNETENVVSVTGVTLSPEVDVAFENFSSGVDTMELSVTATVSSEQTDDSNYSGTAVTSWGAETNQSNEITISDTVTTDGTTQTFSTAIGDFDVNAPALGSVTDSQIGEDDNLVFSQAIPVHTLVQEDGSINDGTSMFPQDIGPDRYGLSLVSVDYEVVLTGGGGDSGTDSSPSHNFDVAVVNTSGTTSDSEIDSNTNGTGTDGTN